MRTSLCSSRNKHQNETNNSCNQRAKDFQNHIKTLTIRCYTVFAKLISNTLFFGTRKKELSEKEVDIPELPEGCITHIISFTSPKDACVSANVSSLFRSAADSDVIWEKFLPLDYIDNISNSGSTLSLSNFSSKKALYFHLCNDPIFLDGGTKYFNLDKRSGKRCFTIGARGLDIEWSFPPYWTWRPHSHSRFAEVAEVRSVSWLKISGTTDTRILSPKTNYAAYLVIQLSEKTFRLDCPVEVWIGIAGDASRVSEKRSVYLKQPSLMRAGIAVPSMRKDGWMEIEMGKFYNIQGDKVEMNLFHHDGKSKSGLIVQGLELRPINHAVAESCSWTDDEDSDYEEESYQDEEE